MSRRRENPEEATINLTPMIDVVFLLVIFFMVGSKFSEADSRMQVSVPSVGEMRSLTRVPDARVIEVSADGSVSLDRSPVTLEQLSITLSQQIENYPGLKVTVRADGANSFQKVAEVMQVVDSSGVQRMGIVARSKSGGMRR
ncbi:ExbD/TolR family protein [Planctomycetes bacterium K23_9]|uniref:Biopolymer transport protein ExbD n=1 Tax=Stieleria marina TaxID=1930275 RepID=A0A517NV97_9BACT|nr:Biopolymer transport protein ExbD [Planctomycetes bacterium K23_9]